MRRYSQQGSRRDERGSEKWLKFFYLHEQPFNIAKIYTEPAFAVFAELVQISYLIL